MREKARGVLNRWGEEDSYILSDGEIEVRRLG